MRKYYVIKTLLKPTVKPVSKGISNNSRLSHVVGTQNIERICLMCKQKYHNLDYCEAFNALPYEKRQSFIKDNHLCFGCLKGNHRTVLVIVKENLSVRHFVALSNPTY